MKKRGLGTIGEERSCPCGSGVPYGRCCGPLHRGARAETAEALMRSRYSAFCLRLVDYLVETTHPQARHSTLRSELRASMAEVEWLGLTLLEQQGGGPGDSEGMVAFVAEYRSQGRPGLLRERSRFERVKGRWLYLDGQG